MGGRICLSSPPTGLDAYCQKRARTTMLGHALAPTWVQLTASTWLAPDQLRIASARRHLAVQTIAGGSGISTGCPSPTTFVLGLGPTNPERTSLPQETLGLRRVRFSLTLRYSCRHSHSRPLQPSSRSTFTANRTLPYHPRAGEPTRRSIASVPSLSPVGFSARNHLTSELLRTLSMMAASEPTSWLSMRLHILCHLAWT